MWWHADLPAALASAPATEAPPEHANQGELLLEWIIPTLAGELPRPDPAEFRDGDEPRDPRHDLADKNT